jgi:hypothetical protein
MKRLRGGGEGSDSNRIWLCTFCKGYVRDMVYSQWTQYTYDYTEIFSYFVCAVNTDKIIYEVHNYHTDKIL